MAAFSRVTAGGWRQGDDATAQARVGSTGWYQVDASAPPDTNAPAWPPGTTLDIVSKTDTTVTLEASADATDAVGVDGYAWSSDGGATYPFTSLTKTFTFTALTELTSYAFRCVPYDAVPNTGTHITVTTSTYRAGDTAANIIANTAAIPGVQQKGAQYDLALTKLSTDWLSYYEVTPPTPPGGTLTPYADGSFTYVGPETATWVIQAETNGVEEASTTTITLYDGVGGGGFFGSRPGQETMYSCMKPAMYPAMNKG